jgi:hypothetical protein
MGRGKNRPEGHCRVCGTIGPLSWEHVPPEAAYNHQRVMRAAQEQLLKPERWDGRRGVAEQRGSGAFTLCERCNNNTGTWYGAEYAAWARQGFERLARIPREEEQPFFIPFRGRPLRFLKQVITMFFSVNGDGFAQRHLELVSLVLDCRSTGLAPSYQVDLVLVRGGFHRSSGLYGTTELATGQTVIASEVAHFPFALRLIVGAAGHDRHGAIEHFAQFGLDDRAEVWLYTIAGHVSTKFPGDYRSPDRVDREAAISSA